MVSAKSAGVTGPRIRREYLGGWEEWAVIQSYEVTESVPRARR